MFVLTHDQKYIISILEETGCLRADHVHKLLVKLHPGIDAAYARSVLKQLKYMGRIYWKTNNAIILPHLRQTDLDLQMLSAIDIMLELLDDKPAALSSKKPPFKLSFLIEREKRIIAYAVAAVEPGSEEVINFQLDAMEDALGMTVIFLLSDSRQSKLIRTKMKHYFAVNDGRVRYFRGD